MDAILCFGICLKRCELFIKASHVGNNFLSAFPLFLHLHLDRKMIPGKLFIVSIHPSKAAAMRYAVQYGCIESYNTKYINADWFVLSVAE